MKSSDGTHGDGIQGKGSNENNASGNPAPSRSGQLATQRAFRFMTGVHTYRIEAASREEALAYAVHALQADENLARVIESTLYEEGAQHFFAAPKSESLPEQSAQDASEDAPSRSEKKQDSLAAVFPFRRGEISSSL
jgi:hypothetical protein